MAPLSQCLCFLAIYISLIVVGGLIFKVTECPDEIAVKQKSAEDKREFREFLTIILSHLKKCSKENGEPELPLIKIIKTLQLHYTITTEKEDFECETWSMYNSIFFSFTIVTTIGYGKVTPQTQLGRGACLFYTIIGVPINCILITFIGYLLKEKVSELCQQGGPLINIHNLEIYYICKFVFQVEKLKGRHTSMFMFALMIMTVVLVFILLPSAMFCYIEGWTYLDGLYYSILSLSTVGFGDLTNESKTEVEQKLGPLIWIYRVFVWLWLVFGISLISFINSIFTEYFKKKAKIIRKFSLIPMTMPMPDYRRGSNISIQSTSVATRPQLVITPTKEITLSEETITILSLHEFEKNEQIEMLRRYEERRNRLWDNFGAEHEDDDFPNNIRQQLDSDNVARETHENRQFNGINNCLLGLLWAKFLVHCF